MRSLVELEKDITEAFRKRSKRFHWSSLIVKGVLITLGASLATIAQFMIPSPDDAAGVPWWRAIGIAASIVVAIGGIFVLFTESDASSEMALAQEAVARARDLQEEYASVGLIKRRFHSAIASNIAQQTLLLFIKERMNVVVGDEDALMVAMLETVGHELSISCGFEQVDTWTINIQRPDEKEGDVGLCPIASQRAVYCDLSKARRWPIDVGVSGRAFQTKRPVMVGDMSDVAIQSALGLPATDVDVYRSIYAHPIIVAGRGDPWGVLIATSNLANHFVQDLGPAQSHYEPLAQFAELAGLALGIRAQNLRSNLVPTSG